MSSYLPPVVAELVADVEDFISGWESAADAAEESAARIAAAQEVASGGPAGAGTVAGAESVTELGVAAETAATAMEDLATSTGTASTATAELAGAAETASGSLGGLANDADDAATALGEYGNEADDAGTASAQLANEADDAGTAVEEEGTALADTATDLAGYTAAAEAATAASTQFGGGALIVGSALDEAAQGLVSMRAGFDEFGRSVTQAGSAMRSMIGQAGSAKSGLDELTGSTDRAAGGARSVGDAAGQAGQKLAQAGRDAESGASGVTHSGEAAHGAEKGWVGLFNLMSHGPDVIDGMTAAIGAAVPVLTGMTMGLAAFATGAGVALLGLDGLEASFSLMDDALEPLKEAASQAFEKTLFPAIEEVSKAAPQMKQSVTDAADAIGGMLKSIVDIGTSSQGIQDLNQWLAGTADFFNQGKVGAAQFAESILTFLAAAAPAMKDFGKDFADVETDWNQLIEKAAQTGEITKAVEGAGEAFKGFMEMIGRTVDAMMKLTASVGPDVGKMFKSIGDAIEAIEPPISMFIKGFTMGIDVIAKIVQAAEGVAEPFSVIAGLLAAIGIGFKVFEWVLAPIKQTIQLFKLLKTAIADTAGLQILWAKFTDALGLTQGAAEKAAKGAAENEAATKLEGDAAEKAAAKNALFTDSLKLKGDAAEKAAAKIALMTDALKLEGEAAEVAAGKNAGFEASAAAAGAASEGAAAKTAAAGTAAESAGADAVAGAAGMGVMGEAAAAAAGTEGVGALGVALDVLTGPIGWAIGAVVALGAAGYAIVQNWPAIKQTASDVWSGVKKAVSDAADSIGQTIKQLPQTIGTAMGDIAYDVVAAGKAVGTFATETVPGFLQKIPGYLDQLGRQWGGFFTQELPNDVSQMGQNVEKTFNALGQFFTQTVPNIIGGLVDGVKNAVGAVADVFGEMWDAGKKEFDKRSGIQSPSKVMADAGKDIVAGLTQGIEQGKSSSIDQAVQWAEELIRSVQQALGIASPSAEFHAIGLHMMEGWHNGIIAGAQHVTDAVRQVSKDATSAAAGAAAGGIAFGGPALTGGYSGAAGGTGGPIQVTLRVEGNDSAMASQIQGMFRKGQIKISANNLVGGRAYQR